MARRALSFADRADIVVGIQAGKSDRQIGADLGCDHTVMWRERQRNSTKTRRYRPVHADCVAGRRRKRPQTRKIDAYSVLEARIRADLKRSRTPRQIAGRLYLEASDPSVETMTKSPDVQGHTVSHEALYRWIYALPKGELAKAGILLQSKRTKRKARNPLGERTGGRIIGMVSIDDRSEEARTGVFQGWGRGISCATRRCLIERRWKTYAVVLSQQHDEAGAVWPGKRREERQAALTTTGRTSTTGWSGSGKQGRKAYARKPAL